MGDSRMKKSIICSKVGEGLANYPHAKQVGNMLYLSGLSARQKDNTVRGARRLSSGVVMKDIAEQTEAVIENMKLILEEVGATLHDLVEVTVFLKNISDYDSFNKVYNNYFDASNGPARTTVAVDALPGKDLLIEMRAIAQITEQKQK